MVHSNSSFGILLFGERLNIPERKWEHQNSWNLLEPNPITIVCDSFHINLYNSWWLYLVFNDYQHSIRSFFASRPYNYGLCGVLGRRTWKTYLECLYCKVKAWIHGGKQHSNMIKSASVWIWVEGWLLKDSLSKSRWLRSWAIFDAHPFSLFFLLEAFSLSSPFYHLFPTLFFQLSLFFHNV
jgi:hypothetical protein